MRVSQRKINPALERELFERLYQVIADLKTTQEVKVFLGDMLGLNELTALVKRLAVSYWLKKGRGVTNVRDNLAVSPATIESIKKQMKSPGFVLAIRKMEADEWANEWTEKIKKLVK